MGLIDAATKTTGTRSANADPLYDSLRLAEPGDAVRAPADASVSTTTSPTTTG